MKEMPTLVVFLCLFLSILGIIFVGKLETRDCECIKIVEQEMQQIKEKVAKIDPDTAMEEKDFYQLQILLKLHSKMSGNKK